MEDEALVVAFQAGDEAAFALLFERYKSRVLRTAFLIVGNHCDSENVLQDSFIKVWRNLPGLNDPTSFRPWLWRIVIRTAWEYCRRQGAEQPVAEVWQEQRPDEDQIPSSLELIVQSERRQELLAAVNRLDIKHRTVVILYYYNEMSVQEIAATTGTLVGTVKSRLFTARRLLRRRLGNNGFFNGEVEQCEN